MLFFMYTISHSGSKMLWDTLIVSIVDNVKYINLNDFIWPWRTRTQSSSGSTWVSTSRFMSKDHRMIKWLIEVIEFAQLFLTLICSTNRIGRLVTSGYHHLDFYTYNQTYFSCNVVVLYLLYSWCGLLVPFDCYIWHCMRNRNPEDE